ncbi:MAG: hypothetical protein MUF06_21330 [Pirellulaceae bacterium]|jgi:hypothetical protein|nr:hypothetical protein [Pirellulaceae bacterium]
MIYDLPALHDPVDQGDIIDGCPVLRISQFSISDLLRELADSLEIEGAFSRVVVLTQTCDLANRKTTVASVALVRDAEQLVQQGLLKASDVRGAIRAGRVFGWYFLPQSDEHGLPESIVDLHPLHTVRLDLLTALCQHGRRRARIQPLYREHLAKHFADTYSRIGLPSPYATD